MSYPTTTGEAVYTYTSAEEGEALEGHDEGTEQGVAMTEDDYTRKKNFPVCFPLFYHRLAVDIKYSKLRLGVKFAYVLWYMLVLALFWNVVAVATAVFLLGNAYLFSASLAIIYLLCGIPVHFLLYYFFLYEGARLVSKGRLMMYLLFSAVHILFYGFCALGVPHTGTGGLVMLVKLWPNHFGAGIIEMVSVVGWLFLLLLALYVDFLVWRGLKHAQAALASLQGEVPEEVANAMIEAAPWEVRPHRPASDGFDRKNRHEAKEEVDEKDRNFGPQNHHRGPGGGGLVSSIMSQLRTSSPVIGQSTSMDSNQAASLKAGGSAGEGQPQVKQPPPQPDIVLPTHFLE